MPVRVCASVYIRALPTCTLMHTRRWHATLLKVWPNKTRKRNSSWQTAQRNGTPPKRCDRQWHAA
eukprot:15454682-Alexandrium_andersonii.AAC.1